MSQHLGPEITWQAAEVRSPNLAQAVPVVAAKNIPYFPDANRLQNLNLYLPATTETSDLVGLPVTSLPSIDSQFGLPRWHVHIHGGAWRDPALNATSIEPTVAHIFDGFDSASSIAGVASLNYTLSQFPTHPGDPYDVVKDGHSDVAREAVHPDHVRDIYHGFALLRSFGLNDRSFVLTGHSCGGALAFQAGLQPPSYYGIEGLEIIPCPVAILGLNGLYDLAALVNSLGAEHELLRQDYTNMLLSAFGTDERVWRAASPTYFDAALITRRVKQGQAPRLVLLDQSHDDQLVPMNQKLQLEATLREVVGLRTLPGHRCTGKHAEPWQQGYVIGDSIRDVLAELQQ